jgi:hypothetical protein
MATYHTSTPHTQAHCNGCNRRIIGPAAYCYQCSWRQLAALKLVRPMTKAVQA